MDIHLHRDSEGRINRISVDADIAEAIRLLATGVAEAVHEGGKDTMSAVETAAVERLVGAQRDSNGAVTPEYLGALSLAYSELAPTTRAVSSQLADALGIATPTLKNHLTRARDAGYLTPASPGRRGGQATERAIEVIKSDADASAEAR